MAYEAVKERFKIKGNVLDANFREPKIDRELTAAFGHKHRGSVRLAMGLFYTDREWQKIRNRVLRTRLP